MNHSNKRWIPTAAIMITFFTLSALLTFSGCSDTANQHTNGAPDTVIHDNQIYFTANSQTSQGTGENLPPNALEDAETSENAEESAIVSAQAELTANYFLRSYNGKIGIFRGMAHAPMKVVDIPVQNLPKDDQAALTAGIPAADKTELNRILEDYE